MTQARGSKGRLAYVEENTWGTTPSNPSMKQLRAIQYGESLGGNLGKIVSEVIQDDRSKANARGGNIDVSGSVPFELPLVGIGTLLKHALGSKTTGQNATPPASPAITGVEILYAEDGATAGDGSLAYTNSSTTLTWTAPSDTAGTAVDVSGGGDFTLESGSDGSFLKVRVNASSLPGQDETDTITVESAYKHRIKRGALPAGLSIEKGFTDIAQYIVFKGCKVGNLDMSISNSGLVTGTLGLMGKEYEPKTSELGAPADVTHTPLVHHEATVTKDGSSVKVQQLDLSIANNLEGGDSAYVIGSRYRDSLNEGQGETSGSITVQFRDQTWLDIWTNETEFALQATFSNSEGSLTVKLPRCKVFADAVPKIETAQGIVQSMDLRPIASTDADNSDVVIELVNDQASL
jgi:hypothetical protein